MDLKYIILYPCELKFSPLLALLLSYLYFSRNLRKEAPAFRHGEELRLTQVPLPPFCKYIHQIAE